MIYTVFQCEYSIIILLADLFVLFQGELLTQASNLIILKITRSFIFKEKEAKMLHYLYNCIFDSTDKRSSSE